MSIKISYRHNSTKQSEVLSEPLYLVENIVHILVGEVRLADDDPEEVHPAIVT